MTSKLRAHDILLDSFDRIPPLYAEAIEGLDVTELLWRPEVDGVKNNSIGWIAWHLARMEDAQVAQLAGRDQVWLSDGWFRRSGVPYQPHAMGYGMGEAEVATFAVTGAQVLLDYYAAVHERSVAVIRSLSDADLARVIDTAYDPPVTVAVRLVSVVDDASQHVGQLAYLRGLRHRR